MKRAVFLVGFVVAQVFAVLALAHFARATTGSLGGTGVTIVACLVYGAPALAAGFAHMRFTLAVSPQLRSLGIRLLTVGFLVLFTHGLGVTALQRSDVMLTDRYVARMQEQLSKEPRFQGIRLLGYSCDYVLFPYIPVEGDVATERDRKDLDRLLRSSGAPAYVSAISVSVGGSYSLEDYINRVREK